MNEKKTATATPDEFERCPICKRLLALNAKGKFPIHWPDKPRMIGKNPIACHGSQRKPK